MSRVLPPGSVLGVLGGGQLGRMFAIEARRLGYFVHSYAPEAASPAGQIADRAESGDYTDLERVAAFARSVDGVTFEFENVPVAAAECAAEHTRVRPRGQVLHTAQHRIREKRFPHDNGLPTAAFETVHDPDSLTEALTRIGLPAVLKTAGFGYDGKGQVVIHNANEAPAAWQAVATDSAVLEGLVDFARELSVVGVRDAEGQFTHFGVTENRHRDHILDVSIPDAVMDEQRFDEAIALTRHCLEALDVVGVLCVEFFQRADGTLLVNELAPRPHNSGHFSVDACVTDQFQQQVRALAGLPLGSTERLRPSAMVNLLGDCWDPGEPAWALALADPAVKLHLYGKAEPRPGRKMGHLLTFDDTGEAAAERALRARDALRSQATA